MLIVSLRSFTVKQCPLEFSMNETSVRGSIVLFFAGNWASPVLVYCKVFRQMSFDVAFLFVIARSPCNCGWTVTRWLFLRSHGGSRCRYQTNNNTCVTTS